MSRPKGSKNHQAPRVPETVSFSTQQKLEFIANLIVERIIQDQKDNNKLLQCIGVGIKQ